MRHDFLTVLWKEITVLRRMYRTPSAFTTTDLYVLLFGVFPALVLDGDFIISPLTVFFLTLAFAGEREAHTLETLFAFRLHDLAILLGKIAATIFYAWLYVLLCILAGWMTTCLVIGRIIADNLQLLIGIGVACFSTTAGHWHRCGRGRSTRPGATCRHSI